MALYHAPVAKPPRTYSEQEAALVLKRAAQLQQAQAGSDSGVRTLAELEEAAQEVGIDRALVRRAATEVRRAAPVETRDNAFLGGPTSIVLEAVVDGEIGPESHEPLITEVRRATREHGQHEVLGRTLTWTTRPVVGQPSARTITVSLTPRGGVTTIRIEEKLSMMAGALFGGILGGVGGGGSGLAVIPFAIAGAPYLIPVALGVWFGGVYAVVRRVYSRKSRKRRSDHERMLAELVAIAEESIAAQAEP